MPLDTSKYIQKKKKPVFIRLLRIYFGTLKHIIKKPLKYLKPLLLFSLKACLWVCVFGAICLFTNYSEEKIPFGLVVFIYILIVVHHYQINSLYKNWEKYGETDEYYKDFCKQWHPNVLFYLIIFSFSLYYFDIFGFIFSNIFAHCFELWDRRYIGNNIKLDMILKNIKH